MSELSDLADALERVERFLDERARPTPFSPKGFLPVDLIALLSPTGDRLLVSDLRVILAAAERAVDLAGSPPGDCEGHPCIWPEDIHAALGGQ